MTRFQVIVFWILAACSCYLHLLSIAYAQTPDACVIATATQNDDWNTNIWNKCCSSAFGGNCYSSYSDRNIGDISATASYPFGINNIYFNSSARDQTCGSLRNFSDCLTSPKGLHKCNDINSDANLKYYFFSSYLEFLTYACSVPYEFAKYLKCRQNYNEYGILYKTDDFIQYYPDTYYLPDTFVDEKDKCMNSIMPSSSSNTSKCRYYNDELMCYVRTDEKFNQKCGNPTFLYYYYAYSTQYIGDFRNFPYYHNNYGCSLNSAPPVCTVNQEWNTLTCTDIAPALQSPYLAGPSINSNGNNETWIEFYCQLFNTSSATNSRYQVIFLFEDQEDPNIPRFNISGSDGKATLHEKFLIGHMGTSVSCSVYSFWTTSPQKQSRIVYSVNRYWIGIEPIKQIKKYWWWSPSENAWSPGGGTIKSTLPVLCSSSSDTCSLSYKLSTTTDFVLDQSSCAGVFRDRDWKAGESRAYNDFTHVLFYPVRDPFLTLNGRWSTVQIRMPVLPNRTVAGESYPNIWSGYTNSMGIIRYDNAQSFCSVSGFLHVRTFDGAQYSTYSCGQFVYVHTKTCQPFEVHVRHWPCDEGTINGPCCVCGIAAREGENILGVDMCTDRVPHSFTYTKKKLPSGYGIQKSATGYSFGISFPTGNKIWVDIYKRRMSFHIFSPSDSQNNLEGLCGSFDGDKSNDILVRGTGKKYQLNDLWTDIGPNDYMQSWGIPPGKSLFDGYLSNTSTSCPYSTRGDIVCSCLADRINCNCRTDLISRNEIEIIHLFTITPRIPFGEGISPTGRRRRDASDFSAIDNIDYGYDSSKYAFANAMTNNTPSSNLIWPTRTGITQDQAQNYCYQTLWMNSTYRNVCSQALSNSDIQNVVNKCILDIQISSDLNQAKDKLSEMQTLCVLHTVMTPVSSGDTGDAIWQTMQLTLRGIQSVLCSPADCNGHGKCENGSCICTNGYNGYDCSVANGHTTPAILGLVDSSTCDVHISSCSSLLMMTANVSGSPSFVCRISVRKGNVLQTYFTSALFFQSATSCDLPSDLLNSFSNHINFTSTNIGGNFQSINPGYPELFYNISISNDNRTFSNNVSIIVFDSLCYDCHATCTTKATACLINGYCFDNNQTNPYKVNERCDISISTTQWSTAQPGTTVVVAGNSETSQTWPTSGVGSSPTALPHSTPKILTISKNFGLLAGSSKLVMTGFNLALANIPVAGVYFIPYIGTFDTLYAYPNASECTENTITILSPRAPNDSYAGASFNIQVEYGGGYRVNTTLDYTYVGNPSISDIQPRTLLATGGVKVTVIGDKINAVSDPIMIVTVIFANTSDSGPPVVTVKNQTCSIKDASHMTCQLPLISLPRAFTNFLSYAGNNPNQRRKRNIRNYLSESIPSEIMESDEYHISFLGSRQIPDSVHGNRSHKSRRRRASTAELNSSDPHVTMALILGFKLDGFSKYENLSTSLPNVKLKLTLTKPGFGTFSKDEVRTFIPGETLKISGSNLDNGCSADDYLITIGDGICEIRTNISANLIQCFPPDIQPAPGNDTICDDTLAVLVTVAQMTYFVFCVRYPVSSIGSTQLIIGLCVGLAILPLTVAVVILVCRKWQSRRTSHPKNEQNAKSDDVFIPDNGLDKGYDVLRSQPATSDTTIYDSTISRSSNSPRGFESVGRRMPAGSITREMNDEYDSSIAGGNGRCYYLGTSPEGIYANVDNERTVGPPRIQKFGDIVGPCKRISLYPIDDNQGTAKNDRLYCRPLPNYSRYPVNQSFENQSYDSRHDHDSAI